MMNDLYIELALNGVTSRGKLYSYKDIDFIALSKKYGLNDCFRSVWLYDEEGYEYSKSNNKMSLFNGKRYIDQIPIDIDKSIEVARDVYNYLIDLKYKVKIFFSGNGYHLTFKKKFKPSIYLIRHVYNFVRELIGQFKIDPTVYRQYSLWRLPYTRNNKSRLFKIELTHDELLNASHSDITKLARTRRFNVI